MENPLAQGDSGSRCGFAWLWWNIEGVYLGPSRVLPDRFPGCLQFGARLCVGVS